MTRKPHQIVWHKKSNKFVPAKFLKPQHEVKSEPTQDQAPAKEDKLKAFAKSFSDEIKRAVRKAS